MEQGTWVALQRAEDYFDGIVLYLDTFGEKACCYFDLKPYISILDTSKATFLLSKVQSLHVPSDSLRYLTVARILRGLRPLEARVEDNVALANEWLGKYVSDGWVDLVALAVALLLDIDRDQKDGPRTHLFRALTLLEHVLETKPTPQLHALLIVCYGAAGAGLAALKLSARARGGKLRRARCQLCA